MHPFSTSLYCHANKLCTVGLLEQWPISVRKYGLLYFVPFRTNSTVLRDFSSLGIHRSLRNLAFNFEMRIEVYCILPSTLTEKTYHETFCWHDVQIYKTCVCIFYSWALRSLLRTKACESWKRFRKKYIEKGSLLGNSIRTICERTSFIEWTQQKYPVIFHTQAFISTTSLSRQFSLNTIHIHTSTYTAD